MERFVMRCAKHDRELRIVEGRIYCAQCQQNRNRREKEDALRSFGLKKVRGCVGGIYWEQEGLKMHIPTQSDPSLNWYASGSNPDKEECQDCEGRGCDRCGGTGYEPRHDADDDADNVYKEIA